MTSQRARSSHFESAAEESAAEATLTAAASETAVVVGAPVSTTGPFGDVEFAGTLEAGFRTSPNCDCAAPVSLPALSVGKISLSVSLSVAESAPVVVQSRLSVAATAADEAPASTFGPLGVRLVRAMAAGKGVGPVALGKLPELSTASPSRVAAEAMDGTRVDGSDADGATANALTEDCLAAVASSTSIPISTFAAITGHNTVDSGCE